ncbi:hypothetical protein TCAL_04636, partial [Tigriopus californicus]
QETSSPNNKVQTFQLRWPLFGWTLYFDLPDAESELTIPSSVQMAPSEAEQEEVSQTEKRTGSRRTFLAGDVILISQPFVGVLDRKWKFQRCDFCFDPFPSRSDPLLPRPLTCPQCSACLYCNGKCRDRALPNHIQEFMMKLILKLHTPSPNTLSDPNNNLANRTISAQRDFGQLLDHYDEIQKDQERMELIDKIYQELLKYELKELPTDFDEFGRVCGKVLINSFNYTLTGGQRIGTALYLEASALNHSCTPNAGFSFQNGNVVIRALETIESDDQTPLEDQITISYIDLLDCTKSRQANLMERYYFQCECHRCQNPELELSMYSIRCQSLNCSGRPVYVGVGRRLEDLDVRPCQECGNKPNAKILEQYLKICCAVQDMSGESFSPSSKSSDECMSLMTGLFHPDHYLYMRMARASFDEHFNREEYELAREYGLLCLSSYRKYKHHVWPSLAQLLFKLGSLEFLHTPSLPKKVAHTHLGEALDILIVTHGQDHEVYQQAKALWQQSKLI